MLPVLGLMKDAAPGWAEWLGVDEDGSVAHVLAHLTKHDGDPISFALVLTSVWDDGLRLVVREERSRARLPPACPERHINRDGTFCLGRGGGFVKCPRSRTEAEVWWGNLGGYLGHQLIAAAARRWPKGFGWRHGGAAEIEELLEEHEARMPSAVVEVGRAAIRGVRPPGGRHPCPCGSGRRFDRCHIGDVSRHLDLFTKMVFAEREFNASWERPCCGTMKDCTVRRTSNPGLDRVSSPVISLVLPVEGWVPEPRAPVAGTGGMRLLVLPWNVLARQASPRPNRAVRRGEGRRRRSSRSDNRGIKGSLAPSMERLTSPNAVAPALPAEEEPSAAK